MQSAESSDDEARPETVKVMTRTADGELVQQVVEVTSDTKIITAASPFDDEPQRDADKCLFLGAEADEMPVCEQQVEDISVQNKLISIDDDKLYNSESDKLISLDSEVASKDSLQMAAPPMEQDLLHTDGAAHTDALVDDLQDLTLIKPDAAPVVAEAVKDIIDLEDGENFDIAAVHAEQDIGADSYAPQTGSDSYIAAAPVGEMAKHDLLMGLGLSGSQSESVNGLSPHDVEMAEPMMQQQRR